MLVGVLTMVVGLLLLSVQSSHVLALPVTLAGPDLFLCLVVHLGLSRDMQEATIPLVLLGYLADVYAASPAGIHLVSSVIVFLLLQLIRSRLAVRGVAVGAFFAGIATLAAALLVWALASVFLRDFVAGPGVLRFALLRALLTIPFAVPVLWLMERIEALGPATNRQRGGLTML